MAEYYFNDAPIQGIDDESELLKLARSVLGSTPVQYAVQTLDKPGRAIRGALSGDFGELANLLPFSDTLGITDPSKSLSGRDVLRRWGAVDGEDNWGNFLGGLALEIGTDPLSFLTIGTKSSLTAAGKAAAKTTGLAETMAGRLGAGQSGLIGVRTPWFTDMLGAPASSKALLTGDAGLSVLNKLEQAATGGRNLIESLPGGKLATGAYDTAGAYARTMFVPGSGQVPDARYTSTLSDTVRPAEQAFRDAAFPEMTAIMGPMNQASDFLASQGIVGPAAERAINSRHTFLTEGSKGYTPMPLLATDDINGAVISSQVEKQLDAILQPSVEASRSLYKGVRDREIAAGVDTMLTKSPYDLGYVPRATMEGGVSKSAPRQARVVPSAALYGGSAQMDDLVRSEVAGIRTQPVPAGVDKKVWDKMLDAQEEAAAQKLFGEAAQHRDSTWGKYEPPVAQPTMAPVEPKVNSVRSKAYDPTGADIAGQASKVKPVADIEAFESAIKNADLTDSGVLNRVIEAIPQLSDEGYESVLNHLSMQLEGLSHGKQSKLAKAIGAKGTDISTGVNQSDNIFDRLMEARTKVEQPSPPSPHPSPSAPSGAVDVPELPYPAELADDNLLKEARETIKIVSNVSQDVAKAGQYYRGDVIGGMVNRVESGASKAGIAHGIIQSLADNAKSFDDIRANPKDWVNLNDALSDAHIGMSGVETAGRTYARGGKSTLAELLDAQGKGGVADAATASRDRVMNSLKEKYVPKDMVNNLAKEYSGIVRPKDPGFLGAIGDYTAAMRSWLTQPWIPFHTRNAYEGVLQSNLNTGIAAKDYADVLAYRTGRMKPTSGESVVRGEFDQIHPNSSTSKLSVSGSTHEGVLEQLEKLTGSSIDPRDVRFSESIKKSAATLAKEEMERYVAEGVASGAFGRHQVVENMGKSVVNEASKVSNPFIRQDGRGVLGNLADFYAGYGPKKMAERGESWTALSPSENVLVQQGMRASGFADDTQRMSQFVSLRRKGYSAQEAKKLVDNSHLDYGALTQFERDMRNIIPFYSFSKSNLRRTATQLENPGALVSLLRATTPRDEDGYAPGYVSSGAALAIPGAEAGSQRYLSGLSMPMDDEVMGAVISAARGDIAGAGRRVLSAANPLIKLGATLATGRQLFSGRRLDEYNPSGLASLLPNYAGNVASELASATPLGRLLTTVNSAAGGKDQGTLLKLLTGVRTSDVRQDMATTMAARDAVAQSLRRTGMTSTAETIFPKAEYRENMPDNLAQLLELMGALRERSGELAAARR